MLDARAARVLLAVTKWNTSRRPPRGKFGLYGVPFSLTNGQRQTLPILHIHLKSRFLHAASLEVPPRAT